MLPFFGSQGMIKVPLGVIGGVFPLPFIVIIGLIFHSHGCLYGTKLTGRGFYIGTAFLGCLGKYGSQPFASVGLKVGHWPRLLGLYGLVYLLELLLVDIFFSRQRLEQLLAQLIAALLACFQVVLLAVNLHLNSNLKCLQGFVLFCLHCHFLKISPC